VPAHAFPADPQLLTGNLRMLALRSREVAKAIAQAASPPQNHVAFFATDDGALGGEIKIGAEGKPRLACSRRDAAREAQVLAETVDVTKSAAILVRGFGMGHHVAALARKMKHLGAIFVYEPDVSLLRGVFERIDCTSWLAASAVVIFTSCDDVSAISTGVQGLEGIVAAGVAMLDHPASQARLGEGADIFAKTFTHIVKSVRTNIVTTLVHADVTVRNCIQNIGPYARAAGVRELAMCAKGIPAVVVSAGPSLRRNIDLLSQPGVRDRIVIIAVQTTLKTLLDRGIKPHFVTALDYHEISRRFYEGLTAEDVEGVTLIAEPKCNPAILESFPGEVRCVGDDLPDRLLGEALIRDMGRIQPGATVSHLAYYFARHIGCDPVILIGQDLGFTDNQYYAPGAAIHQTWAGELSEFNTLEMLEWQRIARMKRLLRPATDQRGRSMYTDEQMATYLVQFERDFGRDARLGLTTIDATEGGVQKQHTTITTLANAFAQHAGEHAAHHALPPTPPPAAVHNSAAVIERLELLRRDSAKIVKLGRTAAETLREMLAHHDDEQRVNRLIGRVQNAAEQAAKTSAYWLVQFICQNGQLKRFRADRAIDLNTSLSPKARQTLQIQRDIENVTWLADAADYLSRLISDGLATLRGAPAITRDPSPTEADETAALGGTASGTDGIKVAPARRRVDACLTAAAGQPPEYLVATLARLKRSRELDGLILMGHDAAMLRDSAAHAGWTREIRIAVIDEAARALRASKVLAARMWSRHCWRGGIANLTIYDEVYHPAMLAGAMEQHTRDAAAIMGGDWTLIDPALVDAAVARYRERPDTYEITFTQAAPGLGACVVTRRIVSESARAGGSFATIGGLLGYMPIAPQADAIVKPVCPAISAAVRDVMMRCIPDSAARREMLQALGEKQNAEQIASAIGTAVRDGTNTIETLTILAPSGTRPDQVAQWVTRFATGREPLAVSLVAAWRDVVQLARAAREAGAAAVHLRTSLLGGDAEVDALLASGGEVISVDLAADRPETYERITGRIDFEASRRGVERLIDASGCDASGLPVRWTVPRIERRDAVYEEIESFYSRWLLAAGACVIDPPRNAEVGGGIEALPLPACVRRHLARTHRTVDLSSPGIEPAPDPTMREGAEHIAERTAA